MDYPTFESMHQELSVAYAELEAQNHSLRDLNQQVELESEKFYKLFYQMPLMIFMVDDHGKIINMNEKASAKVVREREKKVFVSFLSRSSDKSKLFNILGTLKANTTTCIRNALVDFQGVTLTCDIYIFFLMIKSEKMFYLLLVDNTEAVQLAEKIEKSSSQYKYLFDNMFNGMVHHQLVTHSNGVRDTRVLVVNSAFERLTELDKDAAEGQYLRTLFPGLEDVFVDNIYKCVETQSIVSFTMYISYFGREFSTVLYPVNHDKCMGIFEVTNKQLTFETQLKSAMSVLNSTVEGLIVTNADSDIVHVNDAFTKITGYGRDEIIGKKPHLLSSDYHDADFYMRLWTTIHKEGRWQGEIWNKRKNNECYPQWSTISALKNDRGVVTNYVCVFSDISSIKKTEKDIFNLAYFDTLTRLPNRMSFNSHIDSLLKNGHPLALLFMDLDGFKNINDTMGHDTGDRVLVFIATKLRSILRSSDFISRFGGDEFVVILEHDISTNIEHIVNKVIREFNTSQVDDLNINLTFSIGVSLYPQHGDTTSSLLKNADIAMYEAKKAGKNNYKIFDADMLSWVRDRARTDLQIRSAIINNEFFLEYQPEYDIQTGEVHSYEALARWNSPEHGLLYPNSFIEIAEETNLIVDIGDFVCAEVFKQIQGLDRNHPIISINFSIRQLDKDNLIADLLKLMDSYGIQKDKIEIEVTESTAMRQTVNVLNNIQAIKTSGIKLVIDDFGAGYSSFGYLNSLPIYKIKIDRTFLLGVPDNSNNCAIVKAMISLAKNLDLKIVAEGVETEAQLDFLREQGCDYAQGFYLARPQTWDSLAKHVKTAV